MAECLLEDDMNGALKAMQTFLGTVPYTDNTCYEGHWQQVLYIIFSLLGYYADVEVRTPKGRVDMVMRTATRLYLVELKLDAGADLSGAETRRRRGCRHAADRPEAVPRTPRSLRPSRCQGRHQLRPGDSQHQQLGNSVKDNAQPVRQTAGRMAGGGAEIPRPAEYRD